MRMLWIGIVLAVASMPASASNTWFVRADGGTRYSANVPLGQADGLADAACSSSGVNQHCAFAEVPYLWDDNSGVVGAGAWVIAGGDTVIIRGCHAQSTQTNPSDPDCRLGWPRPTGDALNKRCYGVGSYTCYNPPIPAGTAAKHTRILGANYAACNTGNDPSKYAGLLTNLYGGFSLTYTFNLGSTSYVDVQCIALTTHNSQCSTVGSPASPRQCSSSQPVDDYAQNGFLLNQNSLNVTLQDVYVHGFSSSGITGPIGGSITLKRVYVGFNAFAGWNFDDGSDTPNAAGSSITASYVSMIGNGCYEEYPLVHAFPARACYDDSSGGFGDAWSGQDSTLDSFTCDFCTIAYNTKDGFLGPHTAIKTLSITNSQSYGNMGAEWKWGTAANSSTTFHNNFTVMNCYRMTATLPGAAQNFASSSGLAGSYLSDFCRAAGNGFAINTQTGSTASFTNNTIIAANATIADLDCGYYTAGNQFNRQGNCDINTNQWSQNIILGYADSTSGSPVVPGLWYFTPGSNIAVQSSNNVEFGIRNGDTCGVGGILCIDPRFVGEPTQGAVPPESALDSFSTLLAALSPAVGLGYTPPTAVFLPIAVPPVADARDALRPAPDWKVTKALLTIALASLQGIIEALP